MPREKSLSLSKKVKIVRAITVVRGELRQRRYFGGGGKGEILLSDERTRDGSRGNSCEHASLNSEEKTRRLSAIMDQLGKGEYREAKRRENF